MYPIAALLQIFSSERHKKPILNGHDLVAFSWVEYEEDTRERKHLRG